MLTGENGILGNAEKAIAKSENAQIQENATLADYESEVNKYIKSTRENGLKKESLINIEDGIYNKTEKGYIFTVGNDNAITSNNEIKLTNSVEEYDIIVFLTDVFYTTVNQYYFPTVTQFYTTQIKSYYNNNLATTYILNSQAATVGAYISGNFKDNKTFVISRGNTNNSGAWTKIRITDIIGIKY